MSLRTEDSSSACSRVDLIDARVLRKSCAKSCSLPRWCVAMCWREEEEEGSAATARPRRSLRSESYRWHGV